MPGSIRLFVHGALFAGARIDATPGQAHYLGNVMRQVVGNPVRLFNGRDGEWLARIDALTRGHAAMVATEPLRPQAAEPAVTLAFALLKRDATDLVVQKATELGATTLAPVLTARTSAGRVNPERLSAIARGAAEQCERLNVPAVLGLQHLTEFLSGWPMERRLYVAVERADERFLPSARGEEAGLLIGPEGGFADAELDVLRSQPFVAAVSLGPRILRAETAAIAGLALLQAPMCR
jgi:16S rRNA (uracil1498-N3)-methyltransferase